MQTLDDREARIRNSFKRLEDESGTIEKEAIINLLTVGKRHKKTHPIFGAFLDQGNHETFHE